MQATATKMIGVWVVVSQQEVFEDVLSEFLEEIKGYILREEREEKFLRDLETYYVRHVYLYIPLDVWEEIKSKYSEVKHYDDVKKDCDYFLVNYSLLEKDELKRVKKKGNKIVAYAYVMDYKLYTDAIEYEKNQKAIRAFEDYIIEKRYIIKRNFIYNYYIGYELKLTLREWENLLHRYKDLIQKHIE